MQLSFLLGGKVCLDDHLGLGAVPEPFHTEALVAG